MKTQGQTCHLAPGEKRGRHRQLPLGKPGSLPIEQWPKSDRTGWAEACLPAWRLVRGGPASHLNHVSRSDIANRYGLFLDYLQRSGRFEAGQGATSLVSPENVSAFIAELKTRVRSVTVWNSVYKLRRAAQLIAPSTQFGWLAEIEKDLALMMVPRSKNDRLVLTERLVEAGFLLIKEAQMFGKSNFARATGIRNGLLIVLLALHPIRMKNFAGLTIGESFININGRWWIRVTADETKSNRVDQRQVPEFITALVDQYLDTYRTVLNRGNTDERALWISSTTGKRITAKNLGTLISKLTLETIGVDVSPHLFRAAGASTAALYGRKYPHLASALLGHRDPRVTEEHYNQGSSVETGDTYAAIATLYRSQRDSGRCMD
jgi:integrase